MNVSRLSSRSPRAHLGHRMAGVALAATLALFLLTATPALADVPPELEPPPGSMLATTLHASGAAEYYCQFVYGWTYLGVRAWLYDSSGAVVGATGLDPVSGLPSWADFASGQKVVAEAVALTPSPTGAAPWMGFRVTAGTTASPILNYVQQVNTVGGPPPEDECDLWTAINDPRHLAPFDADYNFFYLW